MQPVEFPQQTDVLAKNQPQYTPLPVHVGNKDDNFPMTACFELSQEEIAEIVATKKLWYTQITFGHAFQPVRLSTQNPFEGASPIKALVAALLNDPAYRETWKANVAMAFYDAYGNAESNAAADEVEFNPNIAIIANDAADNFLNTLCTA